MDYQLQQTGPDVQGILNQAPEVVAVGNLNTIDAVGNYYVTDGDGKARGYLICSQSGPAGSPFYLQTYLHDGAIYSRSGNALPLTGEWVAIAYHKPNTGIPKTDLASDVQTSLEKADDAAPQETTYTKDEVDAIIENIDTPITEIQRSALDDTTTPGMYKVVGTTGSSAANSSWISLLLVSDYDFSMIGGSTNHIVTQRLFNGRGVSDSVKIEERTKANNGLWSEWVDIYGSDIDEIWEELAGKQDTISDLSTIRSGAAAGATAYQKPGTGIPKTDLASPVQTSLGKADTSVQPAALTPIQNALSVIESLIPGTASAQNQLADKNYVDTHSSDIDVDDALSTTSENPVQNKVVTNALNGKQATISDLSTIRSGASAGATAVQPATMNTALAAKQDTLTFDNTPTANSNNPVKSGGVKTAIDAKQDTISTVNVTVDNNTGTPSGSASVSGGTLSLSFQNLKGATGAQGPQGIQGVQGVQGPKGDTGVTGDASSLAIIHGIDKTSSYGTTDVCGADAAQALLNEIEGGFYY